MSTKKQHKIEKKLKKEGARSADTSLTPTIALALGMRAVAVVFVCLGGTCVCSLDALLSPAEGKAHILARFVFFLLAQSVASEFFAVLFLQVGRRFVGDTDYANCEPDKLELAVNDEKIAWPPLDLLSDDLKPHAKKPGQPFWLNHVTGRRRCKDAFMRIGMAVGSTFATLIVCHFVDNQNLGSLGLTMDAPFFVDTLLGCCVGVTIVAFMFAVELYAGWLSFLQTFEVFERSERFATCIFWDVVFHLNVSLNEELPVRGWMLFNLKDACMAHYGLRPTIAMLVSMLIESLFFVVMHLPSPGGTRPQSMANIFVGGIAGGLNVLFTGGRLGFALGWHFGWNISMGNVFGLSTSGIPISATFVSVAPHPEKSHLHGGVFGPEGGAVAPFAYGLGIVLLAALYGVPSIE